MAFTYRNSDVDDSILDEEENPCRPCQNLWKKALPEVFTLVQRPVQEVVLVTGHSLWDLAGYALNRLVGDALADSTTHAEVYSVYRQVFEFARRYLNIADLETIQSITRDEYLTKRF